MEGRLGPKPPRRRGGAIGPETIQQRLDDAVERHRTRSSSDNKMIAKNYASGGGARAIWNEHHYLGEHHHYAEVRPDDKVLRDDTGAAIPVRCIEHIFASDGKVWVGFADGTANVVFDAGSEAESGEQRDRVIREIWDSLKRIVCADPNDPENL